MKKEESKMKTKKPEVSKKQLKSEIATLKLEIVRLHGVLNQVMAAANERLPFLGPLRCRVAEAVARVKAWLAGFRR